MSKKINFKFDGKEYCLEYNCNSIKWMEAHGFSETDDSFKLVTMQSVLFAGAFVMHHKNVANDDKFRERIWASITNKAGMNEALSEMAMSVIEDLMAEPPADAEGNTEWSVTD